MLSIWKDLCKLLKKNRFQVVCKFKKKNVERVKENETNMKVFSVKEQKEEYRKKIEQKKKEIILKVKINNFDLDVQMDTGSEVAFTPRNFWESTTLLKEQFTVPPIWWSFIKNCRVLWKFLGVRW